ncbi:DUF3800 domain-containing protein [Methylobacillus arboreus]|uniref:DUF3800 domain-containing protein n=1 Tax=Methylobacillus arboreus TaxID=755170 RepID=UPI001E61AF96|nr:DUF3800 domain-containing protein [Methylobacillus arboreus]MCB5191805.1 DUF3800 domain-containing protein [Methylobacillus arboreus]
MIDTCLSQSRFITFFDECGDHSLTKIDKDFPLFLLCTVIVERDTYARQVIPSLAEFKLRYFAHEGINLHSREIRKAEGPFSILQNASVRQSFLAELSKLMAALPFTLFITTIHKNAYAARYGREARNPYDVALEYSFERILHFMEAQQENQLPVIAEARGQQEDDALRASFHKLMTQGTYYNSAERFQKLICPISFRRKQDNISGIQVADLCAHPTARHLLKPDIANQAFDIVRPHIYTSGNINGLKVHPK